MGQRPSVLREKKARSAIVIGLDNAGKTTILGHLVRIARQYRGLPGGVSTAPTVGLQLVEFRRRNVRWCTWDMSGQGRYRSLWAAYAAHVQGVIFVVDVTDVNRIAVARDELYGILKLSAVKQKGIPVVVLANKWDLHQAGRTPGGASLTTENIQVALGVDSIQVHHPTRVYPTSGKTGAGIEDAFAWLSAQVR